MNYSFKNIYSKAKVAVETDRYVINQTLKYILFILLPQKILVFLKNLINI